MARSPLRTGIDILVFAGLVVLTAFLLRPLQKSLNEHLTVMRDEFIALGEDRLGIRISYESMGPSIFGELDVRKIRLYGEEGLPLLTLSRLRIAYSLPELLRGNWQDSLRAILLDKPVLNLDEEQAARLTALFDRLRGENAPDLADLLDQLPRNLQVRVKGGECSFEYEGSRFSIAGLGLEAAFQEDRVRLEGAWNALADLRLISEETPLTLEMSGGMTGEFDVRQREGTFSFRVPSLAGEGFSLKRVDFDLGIDENRLSLKKRDDASPFDLELDYAFRDHRFSAAFEGRNFSPGHIIYFRGPWEDFNRCLGISATGTASFGAGGEAGLEYALDLQGDLGNYPPAGPLSYVLDCRGDGERVNFERLELKAPIGGAVYNGDLLLDSLSPDGTLVIKDFTLSGGEYLNAELAVSGQGERLSFFGSSLSLGPVKLTALDANLTRSDEGLAFSLSALRFSDSQSYEDIRLSRLSAGGSLDFSPRHLETSVILDEFSVQDLASMAKPFTKYPFDVDAAAGITKDLRITTEIFVTTDFEHLLYNAPRFVAAYSGGRDVLALASVSGTNRRFDLNDLRLVWDSGSAEASGFVDFSQGRDISFALQSAFLEIPYSLEGQFLGGKILNVQGSYGFDASIRAAGKGNYEGYVRADSIPLPIGGQFASLGFSSFVYYESLDFWSVELSRLELINIATPVSQTAALRMSGIADQDWAFFPAIEFDDGGEALSGRADLRWEGEWPKVVFKANLASLDNSETYDLEGTVRLDALKQNAGDQDVLEAHFDGKAIKLDRVLRGARNAVASGDVQINWKSMDSYTLAVNLSSLSAFDGERNINLSAQGFLDEGELRIRDLSCRYGELQAEMPFLRVNRREAYAQAGARLWGLAAGREFDFSLDAQAGFAEVDSWFVIGTALEAFKGSLTVQKLRFDVLKNQEPMVFEFTRDSSALSLSGGPRDMIRFRLTQEGAFFAGLSAPSPVRGTISGSITTQTIDAYSPNLYVDLEALWRFLPSPNILCTGGFVNAAVAIKGPLGDPEFFGVAQGQSVRLLVPRFLSAEVGPSPITVTLEGNEMRFGPLTTTVGKGSGTVSAWFRFDRWIPSTFVLDIQSPSQRPIPFAADIQGIMVKGNAYGVLRLAQEDGSLSVTGNLTGEETEITLDAQEMAAGEFGRLNSPIPVVTDLVVTMGRKMEFLWPSADLPILRAYADAGNSLHITSDTVTGNFSINGDVTLRGGEIFYFQRNFYIRQGSLVFNESELQFDPQLTIMAETRDRTDDGPVTVSLLVDSAPLKSFTARLESNPPLSQAEIFSLLGGNLAPQVQADGSTSTLAAILNPTADLLSQFYIFRNIERRARNLLGLDMLSFRTNLAQNSVLLLSGIRNAPDGLDKPGNYLDNTTVFIGKYLGPNIFIQGMLSLRYDENQFELGGLPLGGEGLALEAEIGIELRNPLFDVRFNVAPLHPENLFINDMSFSLVWRRSF